MSDNFTEAYYGDLQLINEHRAKGISRTIDSTGRTILHIAASKGRTVICRYLLVTLNFDVNSKDFNGYTPLHHAVLGGYFMSSIFLLDQGANPNMTCNAGLTPLHYAAKTGRKDLVNLLITEGAAVDALSFTKGTPLLLAAAYSMKDAVKILLEHNANPNYASHPVLNPLMVAIQTKSVDCVRLLLKHGADPNLGYYGEKPLIFAVLKGRIDIIKCLLTAGAYTNATNFCDLTPIEIAAVEGNLEVLNILFDYTSRIPHIPIWSCHGIYEYINSQEAKNQRELKAEIKFSDANINATQSIRSNDYMTAVYWYTEAIRMKATDATVFCNRSLCFSCLNEGDPALFDAQLCINLSPDWFMGYYRAGIAYMMLKDFKNAAEAFLSALNRHPPNQELQDAYSEALSYSQAPPN
ncbi:uncharacterized protein [Spinacia oleracea]|uniref:PGG domain-containing protein n=1 Tax=Spinacia oleracea TaxID=3562 RepID=A0A9R0I0T4_SPIOL|nr:uncharacterized protein LOC110780394 [Spinacia oleracea]